MQISPQPIGLRITERRRALNMTQRVLAAQVGRSVSWVAKLETGARYPPQSMLAALARALQTTRDSLVGGTDWNGSSVRHGVGGQRLRQRVRRLFADAIGPFQLRRSFVGKRRRPVHGLL